MFLNSDIELEKMEHVCCRDCGEQQFNTLNVEYLVISSDHAEEGDLIETENYVISIQGNEKERYYLECENCGEINHVLYEHFEAGTSGPGSNSKTTYTLLSDQTIELIEQVRSIPSEDLWQAVETNSTISRFFKLSSWTVDTLNSLLELFNEFEKTNSQN